MFGSYYEGRMKSGENNSTSIWPSARTDAVLSVILAFLSVLVGGFGLYMTSRDFFSFPLVIIGLTFWGVACIGVRRLLSSSDEENDSTH